MDTAAFFEAACKPYDPAEANCVFAVAAGAASDPRCARAFAIWRRHQARLFVQIKRPVDAIRVARHIADLCGLEPAGERGPAWGVSLQSYGAVTALRRDLVWYARAAPRGVYRVDPDTVKAAFRVGG